MNRVRNSDGVHFMINQWILIIMVIFMMIGALDKLLGNRFGFGEKFEEGFKAMGPLTLVMVGIISLAPVIADLLKPIITPFYQMIGADPAMFANTLLALDMGGYPLAIELAKTKEASQFSWVFLGTMMGPTIVFTIPVALKMISVQDQKYLALGISTGLITIPIGCLIGGYIAGFNIHMMIVNLLPTILFTFVIVFSMIKNADLVVSFFSSLGKSIEMISIIGLVAVITETLTGFTIIPGMTPFEEGIKIVGVIAATLAGAFPMVTFIRKVLKRQLEQIGSLLQMNNAAVTGLVSSLAHSIPMFAIMKNMDNRGKVLNSAFAVSGAFVFGGHLGFVAAIEQEMVTGMIIGKLSGGITAIIFAHFLCKKYKITS